ncbi:MAG TPA: 2-C-methyl-D-erythritol 2,4-cyclodiphosphate synthase [Steroidobacteraceae bacterium]|jgi:2-C-methyl-D-erythritol 2,4-cyclodiphosphate synthase|nr:2-C-methyl-D-erythritol 2,4-cyclodiphosphate synthase [Steroidobacteraceae bacterium]
MRVGSGIDVHAFGPGDSVVLGGVRIAHTRGVLAHSDGDVLLHALVDALLGAAALGDIGQHFPDSDPQWKGAHSQRFVLAAVDMLSRRSLRVVNADLTLVAQAPKISLWRDEIRRSIALMLALPEACVNLKATTTEHLGFIGRNEGLMALATVLIDDVKAD